MLTEKVSRSPIPATATRVPDPNLICFFQGAMVPMGEARIGVMTHGFLYGTATFEGVRAYWNDEQEQLYGLKFREHYKRLAQSARVLLMDLPSRPTSSSA